MELTITAWVVVAFEAINRAIESGVKTLLGGQGVITGMRHYSMKSLKESEGLRKIRVWGTVVGFDPVHDIHQEVNFCLVCTITKNETGTWVHDQPIFEILKPGIPLSISTENPSC